MDHEKYNKLKKVAKSGEIVRYPYKSNIWNISEKDIFKYIFKENGKQIQILKFLILILILIITFGFQPKMEFLS